MVIRWVMSMAFAKNVCIGMVHQLPAGPDPGKGQVVQQAPWQAWGMLNDWQDTNLGNGHRSKEAAMAAIVEWYEDRRLGKGKGLLKPCPAHFSYRPGCVMCEAVNVEKEKPS